ncbi:MAG: DUF883 family protein [Hyphomonadaceae bacterium]|nr:DUF883 family protein [Hyphomonadaceae bacterium]MBX3511945.1 DUF883 family protein [Hyphomonadaceae bacterium]
MARERVRGADIAAEARDRAEAALETAQDALEAAQDAIEDGIDDAHRYMKRQWKQRPLAVAATALGAGLLLGLLLGARR